MIDIKELKRHFRQELLDYPIETQELDLSHLLKEVEFTLISEVLQRTRGNQTKAAKILGMNRATLRSRLTQGYNRRLSTKA